MKNEIKKLRIALYKLIDEKGIQAEEVLLLSKELDCIINKYYKIEKVSTGEIVS